jgi:hypothetical protein
MRPRTVRPHPQSRFCYESSSITTAIIITKNSMIHSPVGAGQLGNGLTEKFVQQ